MKLRSVITIVLLLSSINLAWANDLKTNDLNNAITQMIRSNLPEATVGVILQDLNSGEILYNYHGAKHFLPASTAKLFSSAAALKELGPHYRYETALYYSMQNGELGLKFSGDPSFKLADLLNLLKKLQELKVSEIRGTIWIDDTTFEGPLLASGWTWDSAPWYYSAPVSAIIIDRNQFGITLFPTKVIGDPVRAQLDKAVLGKQEHKIKANIRAVSASDAETLCQLLVDVDQQNNVDLGGCWPTGSDPLHLNLALRNPRLQAQQLINSALQQLQIKSTAKIKFAKIPVHLQKLTQHDSEQLSVLLKVILGDSDNLYAESVTKTLGAKRFGKGSFKTGVLAIQQILAPFTGIDFKQARLVDGSGASRYNLISPLHLSQLLYAMAQDPTLAKYFRDSLAVSGLTGTLQTRFADFENIASMQAKTGTLNGVSALSGYLTTRTQRELILTILINQALGKSSELKEFEHKLCYFLAEQL